MKPYRPRQPTPFWHFWNPQSDMVGGMIAGAVFTGLLVVIMALTNGS